MEVEEEGFVETVGVPYLFFTTTKLAVAVMDDAMVVGAEHHDVVGIVVVRDGEGFDVMGIHYLRIAIALPYSLSAYLTAMTVGAFELGAYLAVEHSQAHCGGDFADVGGVVGLFVLQFVYRIDVFCERGIVALSVCLHYPKVGLGGGIECHAHLQVFGEGE